MALVLNFPKKIANSTKMEKSLGKKYLLQKRIF